MNILCVSPVIFFTDIRYNRTVAVLSAPWMTEKGYALSLTWGN